MPKLDLETIDGEPHTCGCCGRVLLSDADGLICQCPRWQAQFVGGPMDGVRERYLFDPCGSLTVDGAAYERTGFFGDTHLYEHKP